MYESLLTSPNIWTILTISVLQICQQINRAFIFLRKHHEQNRINRKRNKSRSRLDSRLGDIEAQKHKINADKIKIKSAEIDGF